MIARMLYVSVPSFMHFTLNSALLFVLGLGTRAVVLLRQRCVRRHKIFVRGATTNHYMFLIVLALAIAISLVCMNACYQITTISFRQKPSTVHSFFFFQVCSKKYSFPSLKGVVAFSKFCEDDHEQTYIPPRTFYRRYTLEYKARRLQVTSFSPFPQISHCL